MKGFLRLIALILALSVILSTLAFTVAATDIATEAGVDIDQDIELFTPNAHYTVVDTENVTNVFNTIKGGGSESTAYGLTNLYGGKDVDAYLVEDDTGESYVMIVPSEQAVKTGNVTNHVQINTYIKQNSTYSKDNTSTTPRYYVYDVDVATESTVLPLFAQFVTRKDGSGIWSNTWQPQNSSSSIYMTMTPGVFHRLTIIGDAYTNKAHVFLDNELVTTVTNGVMSADGHTAYTGGATVNLEGMRIQLNSGIKNLNADMSIALDNITDRTFTAAEADNLLTCIENKSLAGWTVNTFDASAEPARLPDMVKINGVGYNNTVDASAALDTYETGYEVELLRAVYSGAITVNCDATINTFSADVSLKAGKDVTLTKKGAGIWVTAFNTTRYSSSLVTSGSFNLTNYVKYDSEDNLISSINQNHSFTDTTLTTDLMNGIKTTTVNGDIRSTVDGNEFFIIYDNSGAENDFAIYNGTPYEVHYQVNANVPLTVADGTVSNFNDIAISKHDLVVFDYDLYSESSFVNVYSGFNLRSKENAPVPATAVYAKNPGEVLMKNSTTEEQNTVELNAGSWNHLTFIGDTATGTVYVYVNGSLAHTTEYALYSADAETSVGVENMCIGSFRTMQIANQPIDGVGGNFASQYLTPEKSIASDNYYLRFVDGSNYTLGMESLADWSGNVYNSDYVSPALPVLATVDGVDCYDVGTINALLNDTDYTTPKRDVVFYRDFIGTVTVNCRATLNLNGITSAIEYGAECKAVADASNGSIINVYKQSPADTTDTSYPIACVWTEDENSATAATLYYASDEQALATLLATPTTETVEVIILRAPSAALDIATNAVVDTNGIDGAVTAPEDESIYVVNTAGDTTQVVVIGNTELILNLNGVDYTAADLAEVQTLLDLADEAVAIEFYATPASALHITSAATIETNGLTGLYYLDEYGFTESVSGTVVTIAADTRVGTVTVNVYVNGTTYTQHISEPLPYGTNINDYLRGKGMLSGTFVIDGTVWTASTYDVTFDDANPFYVSSSSVTYTATPTKSSSADYVYVDASGNLNEAYVTDENVATTLAGWFAQSGNSTLVLNADWALAHTSGSASTAYSGVKNIYLNGHTISLDTNTKSHVWAISGSADYNFYGDGALNFVKNTNTQGIFFANWKYSGTITFSGVTINTSYAIGQLRDGNMVLKDCKVNSFISNTGLSGLISLGEDYNNNYTSAPQTLVITGCEIIHRYSDVTNRYKDRAKDIPLVSHKVVQLTDDQETTVIIDNSYIRAQGSIVRADSYNTATGDANAYLDSNMKLFINDSTIIAKAAYAGNIKAGSIIFYDDIKTNLDDTKGVSFASELLKAKTSDGLASILYTSHDYATVTWSDGETELWAGGSLPSREVTRYDNTDFVNAGEVKTFTATASSLSFSLLGNLTLSDTIGFNIYIPETVQVSAVYMDGRLVQPMDETTYVTKANAMCYCYSIDLAPQEAAKTFTVMIVLADGTRITRPTSVGQYAENLVKTSTKGGDGSTWLSTDAAVQARVLLGAVIGYIEQATMYAGYNVEIVRCSTILTKAGMTVKTPTGTVHDTSALSDYISGAQINISDTVRFRFNLKDGVDPSSILFEIVDDAGKRGAREAILGDGWVELSLRAFELNKDITITVDGKSANYNLYTYYTALQAMTGTSSADQYENTSALRLIQQLYTYAAITDEQLANYNVNS
ncbi:MAG: hypothetical protein IJX38_00145 [Clostridia bacterium]|nr:hypothetical protein [Clostridia bacterium]